MALRWIPDWLIFYFRILAYGNLLLIACWEHGGAATLISNHSYFAATRLARLSPRSSCIFYHYRKREEIAFSWRCSAILEKIQDPAHNRSQPHHSFTISWSVTQVRYFKLFSTLNMEDDDFLFIQETGAPHKAETKSRIKMHVMDRVVNQRRLPKTDRTRVRRIESKDRLVTNFILTRSFGYWSLTWSLVIVFRHRRIKHTHLGCSPESRTWSVLPVYQSIWVTQTPSLYCIIVSDR